MLTQSKAFSGFSVNNIDKAREFYGSLLGLKLQEENGMLTLHINGNQNGTLIYPKGDDHVPAEFTILNFPVANIEATVQQLSAKGVGFEHYEGTDKQGIYREQGPLIAWFKDPAGNVLSLIQV